jgi:hypothetical protein
MECGVALRLPPHSIISFLAFNWIYANPLRFPILLRRRLCQKRGGSIALAFVEEGIILLEEMSRWAD